MTFIVFMLFMLAAVVFAWFLATPAYEHELHFVQWAIIVGCVVIGIIMLKVGDKPPEEQSDTSEAVSTPEPEPKPKWVFNKVEGRDFYIMIDPDTGCEYIAGAFGRSPRSDINGVHKGCRGISATPNPKEPVEDQPEQSAVSEIEIN